MRTRNVFLAVILVIWTSGIVVAGNDEQVVVAALPDVASLPPGSIVLSDAEPEAPDEIRNSAYLVRPLATALSLYSGFFQIYHEGQTAFSPSWALGTAFAAGYIAGLVTMDFQIGAQFRPDGGYLRGWYIELLPGFGVIGDGDNEWYGTLASNVGYQWVGQRGFTVNVAGGVTVGSPPALLVKPNLIFGLGYSFPDRMYTPAR